MRLGMATDNVFTHNDNIADEQTATSKVVNNKMHSPLVLRCRLANALHRPVADATGGEGGHRFVVPHGLCPHRLEDLASV